MHLAILLRMVGWKLLLGELALVADLVLLLVRHHHLLVDCTRFVSAARGHPHQAVVLLCSDVSWAV